jgi:hypothetical protein
MFPNRMIGHSENVHRSSSVQFLFLVTLCVISSGKLIAYEAASDTVRGAVSSDARLVPHNDIQMTSPISVLTTSGS